MSVPSSDVAASRVDGASTLRCVVSGQAPLYGSSEVLSSEMVFVLNTGIATDPEKWRERKRREKELEAQTERLADILERNGIPAYSKSSTTYAVGLVTGHIVPLQRFRVIRFLPLVAKRERAPLINELRLFRQSHPSHRDHLRLGVMTCGPRIPVGAEGELRNAFTELHRNVSRWAQVAARKYNIEVIGRFSEFTVHDEESGRTVHPHANVLYTPRKRLTKRQWRAFLTETNTHFGAWWKDCGPLQSPEEAIKYVSKPADLEKLSDSEIVWLFHETYRMKFAQPMGSFATWRQDTLCKRRDTGLYQDRKVTSVHTPQGARLCVVTKIRRNKVDRSEPVSDLATDERYSSKPTRYMGFTLPQRRVTPFAEPYALIRSSFNATSLDIRNFLSKWSDETQLGDASEENFQEFMRAHKAARKSWDANGGPEPEAALRIGDSLTKSSEDELASVSRFIVHTSRSTAQDTFSQHRRDALVECLSDTEGIMIRYLILEIKTSSTRNGKRRRTIVRYADGIRPLYAESDWNQEIQMGIGIGITKPEVETTRPDQIGKGTTKRRVRKRLVLRTGEQKSARMFVLPLGPV